MRVQARRQPRDRRHLRRLPRADKAHRWGHGSARTGNVAFDDWRDKELERLAEERRKLDEMLDEFDEYARELRRAKDQEEFDRFMANRNKSTAPTTTAKAKPRVVDAGPARRRVMRLGPTDGRRR